MTETSVAQTRAHSERHVAELVTPNRRGRGSRSRGASGHGRHRGGQQDAAPRDQTVAENTTETGNSGRPGPESSRPTRGRRSRGGGHHGHARATTRGGLVSGTQRRFGGHLTTEANESGVSPPALSADAPEFVPGQPLSQRSHPVQQPRARSGPLAAKSTAVDLPTRIHEDIGNNQYECVICTSEILRTSRVWSCSICWTVVHLPCVKKWYTNHQKKEEQQQRPEDQQPQSWRCPGCNLPMTEEPNTYHCWCGKDINPRPIMGLPPHSCGQTCSKPRSTCPHPCSLECHAGPCPPCDRMGPTQSCFCGKSATTKRCVETNYEKGWSCQETCGDLLPCGEHDCPRPCHAGLCGSCEIFVSSRCYCGKVEKDIPCDQRDDLITSFDLRANNQNGNKDWFDGSFSCDAPCNREFDCGYHACEKACHAQDERSAHCPYSPDVVSTCPCGKTDLNQLLANPRESCQDDIPHCHKICGKVLSCGHSCADVCHTGSCSPCIQKVDVQCRCGRSTTQDVCHRDAPQPLCSRSCQATLNCGRHTCGERCCPGERRALERQAAKKKNKAPVSDDIEAEHICIRVCGRGLKCGSHACQQLCHKGPCPSCLEAVFEEISCACGRTVLQPPQPCGTRAPECRFECTRQPSCGHPKVQHNCHPEDTACPKCPFLVEKLCICGKQRLKNQPCWFEEARCGLPCGKKLKCGTHVCRKQCHKPGQCEDAEIQGSHCSQPCGKMRKSCDHTCLDECHAPFACKEDKPCQSKTFVTCECQNRKQEVKCLATLTNNAPSRDSLKCDDECLRLQRNRRLAEALSIDPDTLADEHVPYSDVTLRLFRDGPAAWVQAQEREFRLFAADPAEKRIRFKPMARQQRAFLHALAEDYGLDSESQDPEPHRHVCVFKTPRFVSAPRKTLGQCVRIRSSQAAAEVKAANAAASAAAAAATELSFNALLLQGSRFALTVEEVDAALAPELATFPLLSFSTTFLPSDEVVVRAATSGTWGAPTPAAVEATMTTLKPRVSRAVQADGLAKTVLLCHADADLRITRREGGPGAPGAAAPGGWNAVVSRAAQKRAAAAATAEKPAEGRVASSFVGLKKKPEKKVEEPIEDDWEAAAERMDD